MMLARKQTLIFSTFLLLLSALIIFSFSSRWDGGRFKSIDEVDDGHEASQESYFKVVDYFITENGLPKLDLIADELTLDNQKGTSFFIMPQGNAHNEKGEKVYYEGEKGNYDKNAAILVLEKDAFLKQETSEGRAKKITYYGNEDTIHMVGDVKTKTHYVEEGDWIFLNADEAFFYPETEKSKYLNNVDGLIKRKRVYEDSISFKSRILELDMKTLKADLTHDVWLKKQNLTATSLRGEIFLENYNKKLKYFVLYDDVKVLEKVMLDGQLIYRKAFSEKLEGMPSESKIILTGYPKVYQQGDVIKGNRITLRENTEVVEVDDSNSKFKVE